MSSRSKSASKGAAVAAPLAASKTASASQSEKKAVVAVASGAGAVASKDSSKRPMPTCPVPEATVLRAATALVNHIKSEKKSKGERPDLINEGVPLFVTIRQFRIPGREKSKPQRISVPHSVLNPEDGVSLCIIVKDPAKAFKEQLAASPVPGFTKVIGVSKLKKNYSQYKDKLELVGQYDAFFADDRVVRMMPQLVGKAFLERRKMPLPVDISGKESWAREMAKARDSAWLHVGSQTTSVKIGHSGMKPEALAANAMAVINGAVVRLPGKWRNIQRIDIMGTNTLPLPVYKALPNMTVAIEGSEDEGEGGDDSSDDEEGEGELEVDTDDDSSDDEDDAGKKQTKGKPAKKAVKISEAEAEALDLSDDEDVKAISFLVAKDGAKLKKEGKKEGAAAAAPAPASAAAPAKKAAKPSAPPAKKAKKEESESEEEDDLLGLQGAASDDDEDDEEDEDEDVAVEVTKKRKGEIAAKLGATGAKAAAAAASSKKAAEASKPAPVKAAPAKEKEAAKKPAAAAAAPAATKGKAAAAGSKGKGK